MKQLILFLVICEACYSMHLDNNSQLNNLNNTQQRIEFDQKVNEITRRSQKKIMIGAGLLFVGYFVALGGGMWGRILLDDDQHNSTGLGIMLSSLISGSATAGIGGLLWRDVDLDAQYVSKVAKIIMPKKIN